MNISELIAEIAPKLPVIAENGQKVYDKGYEEGKSLGFNEGYDLGGIDERKMIWDAIQQGGTRTNFESCFYNWRLEGIRPIYDIRPTTCGYMFRGCTGVVTDLASAFEECGIIFDTSASKSFSWMFFGARVSRVPDIDTTNATTLDSTFYSCTYLKKIDKLKLKDDGSQTFTSVFNNDTSLEELIVEGRIGQNGFNVQWATNLSKASIESIINALSNTTTGLTVTLSLAAVKKAFETSEGANDGSTSTEWATLTEMKSNWNIALV